MTGVAAMSGSPVITDDQVTGTDQGLLVAVGATPVPVGNTICENGANLALPEGAEALDVTGTRSAPTPPDKRRSRDRFPVPMAKA